MKKWKVNSSQIVFKRPLYNIEEFQCTNEKRNIDHNFTIMHTPDWLNIVAINTEGCFIMVKQHRLGTDQFTIETPSGLLEPGENPKDGALRELAEETGHISNSISLLQSIKANPAIMDTTIHIFLALDCKKNKQQNLDPTEDIDVLLFTKDEIKTMITNGDIDHSIVVSALSFYFIQNNAYENL